METGKNNVFILHVSEVVNTVLKKMWLILLCAVLFGAAGAGYAYFTADNTPMYSTSNKLYITGTTSVVPSGTSFSLGQSVIAYYVELMNSRPVLEEVINNLGLNMTTSELAGCISTQNIQGTCLLKVTVVFPDAEWAKIVLDELTVDTAAYALEILGCSPPTVYEEAIVPTRPYNIDNSGMIKFGALGAIGGAAIAGFLVLFFFFINTRFVNPNRVIDRLGIENLGVVPNSKRKNARYEDKAYAELYNRFKYSVTENKVIALATDVLVPTKAEFTEKFTDYITNAGKKVIVLDATLSNEAWGVVESKEGKKSLNDYLDGKASINEIIVKRGNVPDSIFVGEEDATWCEKLESDMFKTLLDELKNRYDFVFVNIAPLNYSKEGVIVAKQAEYVMMVISAKTSRTYKVKECIKSLPEEVTVNSATLIDVDIKKGGKYFRKTFGEYYGEY